MATTRKYLFDNYDGNGFAAQYSKYSERATTDELGNDLTLTIENSRVTQIGGKAISAVAQLVDPTVDNSVLAGDSTGAKEWKALTKAPWGTVITDAENNPMLDENGNSIYDENEVELWISFDGVNFGAERAVADVEGNAFIDTYAKKTELPDVSRFQQKLVPASAEASASVTVANNKVSSIELASEHSISAMAISCAVAAGESPNFAVEIDNKSATVDCTVSLAVTVGGVSKTMKLAASTGTATVEKGKFYQLTCVGSCWTLAEFATPT